MISYSYAKRFNGLLLAILLLPLIAYAGDPVPGIGITVEQATTGISASGTTGSNGELILSGFKQGRCVVTILKDGQATVIGNGRSNVVTIPPAHSKAPIKPIRLKLAHSSAKGKASSNSARQMANHNTTRSNKTAPAALDDDDDGDSIPTARANHNTTRSNRLTPKTADTGGDSAISKANHNVTRSNKLAPQANDMDDDCDGIVEITPMQDGRIRIKVSCG